MVVFLALRYVALALALALRVVTLLTSLNITLLNMADNNKTKMVLNRDNSIIVNPAAFSEVHSSDYRLIFGRPFVKRFALCYRTVSLSVLSCQSVTLLYCGQTVGWIKMKLDTELGLGPGHIVLDEEPASASKMGHSFPIVVVGVSETLRR